MQPTAKKRVIVCGYPKSGNTWITRLVAEVLCCPVVGFWCQPFNKEEAIEGLDRESEYQCFKAHHNVHDMKHTFKYYANGSEKIIYVVRDPRDVVVSASYYFSLSKPRHKVLRDAMSVTRYTLAKHEELFHTRKYKLGLFARKLLDGGAEEDSPWLRTSWREHVLGYVNSGALVVRYEDMQAKPTHETQRICEYLNIERSSAQVSIAVYNQSFSKRKQEFLQTGSDKKARFLRKGTTEQWRDALSVEHLTEIHKRIGDVLLQLGYPI